MKRFNRHEMFTLFLVLYAHGTAICACRKFEIFTLLETWLCQLSDIADAFSGYFVYFSSREQRLKGDVAVCIHKTVSLDTVLLKQAEDFFLKLCKSVLDDIIVAYVYVALVRLIIYRSKTKLCIKSFTFLYLSIWAFVRLNIKWSSWYWRPRISTRHLWHILMIWPMLLTTLLTFNVKFAI